MCVKEIFHKLLPNNIFNNQKYLLFQNEIIKIGLSCFDKNLMSNCFKLLIKMKLNHTINLLVSFLF
jgi:hypothetical protein